MTGDASRDQEVLRIIFTNDGSARGTDLQRFRLQTTSGGTLCGLATAMDGDTVDLLCEPPFLVRRNEVRILNLIADIRASRRRTVRFLIDEPSDIHIVPAGRK